MGLLSLFKPVDTTTFSRKLAKDIAKRYPPALDQQPGKRPSVNRLTRILEEACEQAVTFKSENSLGIIGKARLSNAFRWELADLGYTKEFVALAVEALVVSMSRKPRQ